MLVPVYHIPSANPAPQLIEKGQIAAGDPYTARCGQPRGMTFSWGCAFLVSHLAMFVVGVLLGKVL